MKEKEEYSKGKKVNQSWDNHILNSNEVYL